MQRRVFSLLCLVALTCAAAPELHFAGASYLSRSERSDPFLMRKFLYPALKQAGIDRIELEAGADSVVQLRSRTGSMSLDLLPPPALQAIVLVLQDQYVGAEIDILVQGSGPQDPDRMWTVQRDLEHRIVVVRGQPPHMLDGLDPLPAELGERFGIGALEDSSSARWSADERRVLARTLALLSAEELDLLKGVDFRRRKGSRVPLQAGIYEREPTSPVGRITLFDLAFQQNARTHYVGPAEAAEPYAVYVVAHEIGHAIADIHRERALVRYRKDIESYNQRNAAVNELIAAYNHNVELMNAAASPEPELELSQQQLDVQIAGGKRELENEALRIDELRTRIDRATRGRPPMEQIYSALPHALEGPTPYGRTASTESFAESFALFHVDPAALRRIAPDVHAWFESGDHMRISALPDD